MLTRSKTTAGLPIAIALAVLSVLHWARELRPHSSEQSSLTSLIRPASSADFPALVRSLRPIYPYSVIAGGVFSQTELQDRLLSDSVARQHYAEFDVGQTRLVRLDRDRLQYVSYRMQDRVYWSKKQLRIPRGELLLTDGRHFARTRCGNLLSETPKTRVSAEEPTRQIDVPPVSPASIGNAEIKLLKTPDIQIPDELPRDLTELFDVPPAIRSFSAKELNNEAPWSLFVTTPMLNVGRIPPSAPPPIVPPKPPTVPGGPGPGGTVTPPVLLTPEPRFAMAAGLLGLLLLAQASRLKKMLRQAIRC